MALRTAAHCQWRTYPANGIATQLQPQCDTFPLRVALVVRHNGHAIVRCNQNLHLVHQGALATPLPIPYILT